MPYRAFKNKTQQKKNGRWVTIKIHRTAEEARRHAVALNINVHKKGK